MTLAAKTLNFTLTKLVKQERNPENVEKYLIKRKERDRGKVNTSLKKNFYLLQQQSCRINYGEKKQEYSGDAQGGTSDK